MTLKQQILNILDSADFPDLRFLYSPEALVVAPEVLSELLRQEKSQFHDKLMTIDSEICFETFDDTSILDYYFGLLEHWQSVHGDDVIRKIIEDFEPKYIDF